MHLPQNQEGRRRQKEIGYIWRREQATEIVQNRDNLTLDETNLVHNPDGQFMRFQQSLHIKLGTTGSEEDNKEPLDSEFSQRPEITEFQSLSGSPRFQNSSGWKRSLFQINVAVREVLLLSSCL